MVVLETRPFKSTKSPGLSMQTVDSPIPQGIFTLILPFARIDWTLLVADETALPAVGTILDEAPAGARVLLVAEVADEAEQLVFDTAAELTTVWCHRGEQHDGFGMLAAQVPGTWPFPMGAVRAGPGWKPRPRVPSAGTCSASAAWSGSRCTPGATGSWTSPITRTTTPARTDLCRRASTTGRSAKEKTIIIPNGPEYYDLSHLSAPGQPLPQGARRRPSAVGTTRPHRQSTDRPRRFGVLFNQR